MTGQIAQNGFERAHRPRVQASALLALLVADGVLTRALGGPAWLTGLYAGLGVVCAAARLGLGRRRGAVRTPASRHSPAPQAGGVVRRVPVRRTAIGYMRIAAPGDRATLAAHHSAIAAHADAHGLELWAVVHDVDGDPAGRRALRWALERIAASDAQVLAVARLAHVAGRAGDLAALLRFLDRDGRALVAVEPQIDTSTPAGRLAALALDGTGAWTQPRRDAPPPPANGRAAVAGRPERQHARHPHGAGHGRRRPASGPAANGE